jgi:predicted RNA-binding protein YlqC (UPF0109 family)
VEEALTRSVSDADRRMILGIRHRQEQTTVFELRVAQSDLGKVIGKQGRTASSIRTIISAAGMKLKKRFTLEILE